MYFLFIYFYFCSVIVDYENIKFKEDRGGRDHMVVGFTTTCAISADHQ